MSLISPATSRMDEEQPVDDLEYAFDFLSATFGSTLPRGQVPIVPAVPMDACAHLETPVGGMRYSGAGVLVRRGGCSFGVKAKNVQVSLSERNRTGGGGRAAKLYYLILRLGNLAFDLQRREWRKFMPKGDGHQTNTYSSAELPFLNELRPAPHRVPAIKARWRGSVKRRLTICYASAEPCYISAAISCTTSAHKTPEGGRGEGEVG